jgi:hypothetical protein
LVFVRASRSTMFSSAMFWTTCGVKFGPIVSGQPQQQLLLAALGGFGTMDAGHGFAVVDVGVALLKEPLDAGLRANGAAAEGRGACRSASVLGCGRTADVLVVLIQTGPVVLGLLEDHLQSLHSDVIQPGIVALGGVLQSDLRLEMAVLQGGGDEAAGAAHDEVREGAAEARRVQVLDGIWGNRHAAIGGG